MTDPDTSASGSVKAIARDDAGFCAGFCTACLAHKFVRPHFCASFLHRLCGEILDTLVAELLLGAAACPSEHSRARLFLPWRPNLRCQRWRQSQRRRCLSMGKRLVEVNPSSMPVRITLVVEFRIPRKPFRWIAGRVSRKSEKMGTPSMTVDSKRNRVSLAFGESAQFVVGKNDWALIGGDRVSIQFERGPQVVDGRLAVRDVQSDVASKRTSAFVARSQSRTLESLYPAAVDRRPRAASIPSMFAIHPRPRDATPVTR